MYAYDHTVDKFPVTGYSNLHFVRTGIGPVNNVTDKGELKTLDTVLRDNGHSGAIINYLKVCFVFGVFNILFKITGSVTMAVREGNLFTLFISFSILPYLALPFPPNSYHLYIHQNRPDGRATVATLYFCCYR